MEKQNLPEKNLKMYEVPGQDKISEHSLIRYKKDKSNLHIEGAEKVPFSTSITITHEKLSPKDEELRQKIKEAPLGEIPEVIQKGLKQNDPAIQKICIESIGNVLSNLRADLLREAFEIENEEVQLACVREISNIPEGKRSEMIRVGLSKESFLVKKASVKMIEFAPKELRTKLIREGLSENDIELAKAYIKVIHTVQEERERKELLGLAKQKLGNALVETPLYDNSDISKERFSRGPFAKTGSGTTLIGGNLKDKVIFRHISPEAFHSWQEVYENQELWKRAGFDYVPIEPIVSFHQNKDGLIDVASGILDISFGDWEQMSGDFSKELDKDKIKIKSILQKTGIVHGHPHDKNFCLRFFRKENGDVDFKKKPRIYLIDFDRAVSPD